MKFVSIFTSILFLVSFAMLQAKDAQLPDLSKIKHPVKPMLWKVEGKGLKKPSYLLASYYSADPRLTTFHPVVEEAFDQADIYCAEYNSSPETKDDRRQSFVRNDHQSLTEILGLELTMSFRRELKKVHPNYQVSQFSHFKIWYLAGMLPALHTGEFEEEYFPGLVFEKAKKSKMPFVDLSMVKTRIDANDRLTLDEQIGLLRTVLKIMQKERELGQIHFQDMVTAYLDGDAEALLQILNSHEYLGVVMDKKINDKMNELRENVINPPLTKKIEGVLQKKKGESVFFLIGFDSLVGRHSVCARLQSKGYTVTRVQ